MPSEEEQPKQQNQKLNADKSPEPEEIQINLKKFALVLGIILIFSLIAGAITEFGT
jgi:hypothetical protein